MEHVQPRSDSAVIIRAEAAAVVREELCSSTGGRTLVYEKEEWDEKRSFFFYKVDLIINKVDSIKICIEL